MPHVILGPTLETERLILRPPAAEDYESWWAMMQNNDVAHFIGGQSRYIVWRLFSAMAGSWALNGFAQFSVIEKSSGAWIGRVGPWEPAGWPGAEVAYTLARPYWGKGYATEAATTSINWAFDHLGWTNVIHCIDPANINSQKVAQRLGSRLLKRDVPLPPDETLGEIWGQSREEWRTRAKT
jgi:RimJ/RimL family protein N-acetyltransferase